MGIVHEGEGSETKVVGAMKYVGDLARYTLARLLERGSSALDYAERESLMGRRFGITRSRVFLFKESLVDVSPSYCS